MPQNKNAIARYIILDRLLQHKYGHTIAELNDLCNDKLEENGKEPEAAFVMRNDMPCGSTVGPTISASLGIPTVDIGEPMLSMHSIREMTDVADHEKMTRLLLAFWK